jgi:hypothetical protein
MGKIKHVQDFIVTDPNSASSTMFKLIRKDHTTRYFLDKKYTKQTTVLRKSFMKFEPG